MTIDLFKGYLPGIHMLDIPTILFSKAIKEPSFEEMLLFYEADRKFKRIRDNSTYWIDFASKHPIVASPDFSIYWSMSLDEQKQNKDFNLWFGREVQKKNPNTVFNVRFGDARSYDFCFDGYPQNSIVMVGTHGCIKRYDERLVFKAGFGELVRRLTPRIVVVYGRAPLDIFGDYASRGGVVLRIPSEFEKKHP